MDTSSRGYAARLEALGGAWWKRWLDVQAPYRWNLRRLELGRTLDVGCGIGRNLLHLAGSGVGVDHNPHSVEVARRSGCSAYTSQEFRSSSAAVSSSFDSLLFAHVLEHMALANAIALVGDYLEFLRPDGKVVLIAPQEAGYRSDPSHVEFMDFPILRRILRDNGLGRSSEYSFPLPRPLGRIFVHNEFVVVGRKGERPAPQAVAHNRG